MMRREFVRPRSRAAQWALPPSVFAPVLAAVAVLVHRMGLLSDINFVLVLAVALVLALAGALLALAGIHALWQRAAEGGRRSGLALLFCAPLLIPAGWTVWMYQTTAPVSDVSTDLVDPPHFELALQGTGGNQNEPPRLNAAEQNKFYPWIKGRRYALSAEGIVAHAALLAAANGWTVLSGKPVQNNAGEWIIEAQATTLVLGFVDDVLIRITDEGESTYVDMRSASRFGARDYGANAFRIRKFMDDLTLAIQGGASAQ